MKVNVRQFESEVQKLLQPLTDLNKQFNDFLKRNPDFLNKVGHYLKTWPEYHKQDWRMLASFGWFLNWKTPVTAEVALKNGKRHIDAFMMAHLKQDWDVIAGRIISLYGERKHILQTAFELHQGGNYIASVPLFLSQIDGICARHLQAFLFSEHSKRSEKIKQLVSQSPNLLTNAFLEVLNTETQFGAGISSHSRAKKELAPNRNGILHGSRKHLDYGTEMNSFKAFSLLAFVVYTFNHRIHQ